MFRRLAPLCVSLLATAALAQTPIQRTAAVTFAAPATWEDGSPFDCTAVNCSYSVYRGACGSTAKTRVANGVRALSVNIPNTTPGQCFNVAAVVGNIESPWSAEARYRGNPNAPTITIVISVEVSTSTVEAPKP